MSLSTRSIVILLASAAMPALAFAEDSASSQTDGNWIRHVVHEGQRAMTAVATDVNGDGLPDVITDSGEQTRLFVAPDWEEIVLDDHAGVKTYIHSECFDVDGDGDVDYVGARYNPGLIVWLEQPASPLTQRWTKRVINKDVHGIHGLIQGDVDGDGSTDLLATSAQPQPPYSESLVWFAVPPNPLDPVTWKPHAFADGDAPGLTHYLGVGDVDGDGRLDAATGAKGGPQATSTGDYFAWWQSPLDPTTPWTKNMISDREPGATNVHPADVDGDGDLDFVASRGHGKGVIWFEAPTWSRHNIDELIQEPHCLAVVDMDKDGDMDVATCAFGDKVAAWYQNDGTGRFRKHVVGTDQEAYDIRIVDMDLDDDLDMLIAGRGSNNVVWYENPSLR